MSHGSETRKMRGGDTGVKGRRSREGAGLGKQIQADHMQGDPPLEEIKKLEGFWNRLSHEWLGTDKSTFPYNMGKWDKDKGQGSSMITTPRSTRSRDKYSTFENRRDSYMMDGRHGESLMLPLVQRGRPAYPSWNPTSKELMTEVDSILRKK